MVFSTFVVALSLSGASIQAAKPNVVIILADDIGYGDLSCYGATKVKTPNLDKLAKNGIRFTDAHSPATVCTPTRYSLMTGEYSFRNAPGAGILSGVAPLSIPTNKNTIAKVFQKAGYQTGVVGKWHLGLGTETTNYNKPITAGPKEVGFDYSFILPATGDRVPCVFVQNGSVVGYDPKDPIEVNYRAKVGNDPTGRENPELLKIKPIVGHADTIVNGVSRIGFMSGGKAARWVDEDIADTFTNKATKFIEENHKKPFFLYLPTHDVHAPLLPNPRFKGKSQCGLRGDTITELDWTVGEVMKTLDKYKLTKNTVVIFTSDNGAVDNDGYADPRENLNGHLVNGPLRGTKYSLYEGGHRVPFILSWPAKTPRNRTSGALVSHTDLMSSFSKLLNVPLEASDAPDSASLEAAFFRGSAKGRESLITHQGVFGSPLAYREGKWVIVPKGKEWELYDLSADLAEKNNVADMHPDIVTKMVSALDQGRQQKGTRTGFRAKDN